MNGQDILLPTQNMTPMLETGVEAGALPGDPTFPEPPPDPRLPEPPPDPGLPEPPRRPEDPQPVVEEPPAIPPEVPNPIGDPPPDIPRPFGPGRRNPGVGARVRINRIHECKDREHRQSQCVNG